MPDKSTYKVVIPARYASQRLPGKPLITLNGKTMLEHVYRCALRTRASEVVIATDDQRIADEAKSFCENVLMTSKNHPSGTDRIAEVATQRGWKSDAIVVNLQGDEPLMPASLVDQVAGNLFANNDASISTLCYPLTEYAEITDPAKVKVVFDHVNMALYFSRSVIPFSRDHANVESLVGVYRHVGLYAYRVDFLKAFTELEACAIEKLEQLEQLRALWHGYKIHVDIATELPGQDVNVQDDIAEVERILASQKWS